MSITGTHNLVPVKFWGTRHLDPNEAVDDKAVWYACQIDSFTGRGNEKLPLLRPDTIGDVHGMGLWRVFQGSREDLHTHSFAFPSIIVKSGDLPGTRTRASSNYEAQPVFDDIDKPDTRYRAKVPQTPWWTNDVPKDWIGSMLHGTNELAESPDEFIPGFWGVVCINRDGDPGLSTFFHEVAADNSVSKSHFGPAHTHTAFGVADIELCDMRQSVITFQLHQAGKKGGPGYNIWVDYRKGPKNPEYAVGASVYPISQGPFESGVDGCKHPPIGKDADGNPIRSLHLSTYALWLGQGNDGPLAFEIDPFPEVKHAPHRTHVHLQYDITRGHHWAGCDSGGDGKWAWWAESWIVPEEGNGQPPPHNPPPYTEPPKFPPRPKTGDPFGPVPLPFTSAFLTGTGLYRQVPPQIFERSVAIGQQLNSSQQGLFQAASEQASGRFERTPRNVSRCPHVGDLVRDYFAMVTNTLLAAGGVMFRGVADAANQVDLTRAAGPTPEEIATTRDGPLTGGFMAYGRNPTGTWEGFRVGAVHTPERAPVTDGGMMIIPPRANLLDLYVGTQTFETFTRFLFPSNSSGTGYTCLAFGRPDRDTGGINTGYDVVASVGSLAFNAVNSAGATVASFVMGATGHLDMTQVGAPGTPTLGDGRLYVSSSDGNIHYIDDGGTDTDLTTGGTALPVGCLVPWAGDESGTIPAGYLLCAGQAVSRATFAALFAAIGTTYGPGDSMTTFNLPDMRAQVLMGTNNANLPGGTNGAFSTRNRAASSIGAETHALSAAELAVHAHNVEHGHSFTQPTISASFVAGAGCDNNTLVGGDSMSALCMPQPTVGTTGGAVGAASITNTANAGSGTAHNNVQPSIVANWLIKT